MFPTSSNPASCILLTGVTGFLGKVVLEELFRRRKEFAFRKIILLTRPKRGHDAQTRFFEDVANSGCFSLLPTGWTDLVQVSASDLRETKCGIDDETYESICNEITHIIHCAGSIKFDLPIAEAAAANISSNMNMLELARKSPRLQRMVSTSTAYVSPHTTAPIWEALAPLPRPAVELFSNIQQGTVTEAELLRSTGHPNTYTLTKCIAEHLLMERQGSIPLTIVRPSIISASWHHPFPGWIDSQAALAGFVALTGSGMLHVVDGNPKALLDIIPVDEVARRLIEAGFASAKVNDASILYSVAGPENRTIELHTIASIVTDFFRDNRVGPQPKMHYLGHRGLRYHFYETTRQMLSVKLAKTYYKLRGDSKKQRRVEGVGDALTAINKIFPYFTHHTFDFRPSESICDNFDMERYLHVVCRGVQRNLLKRDTSQLLLGGSAYHAPSNDLRWAFTQPHGNAAIRITGVVLRKALRRMFESVTFDAESFDRAILSASAGVSAGAGNVPNIVIIPMHRSYLDFLLLPYLLFAHPSLNIPIPHIAAAAEFADLPLLGAWFRATHAFFVRRGQGGPDPGLNAQIQELVEKDEALMFFIEGARSRSRAFLPPRRGLLRALQATGQPFVVLPVSISYDQVAEESPFSCELRGERKGKMHLGGLVRWTGRMVRGEVKLGRMHIRCGEPLPFDKATDVREFSGAVMRELQAGTVASTFHLECFVRRNPGSGISASWLREAIQERGGVVLDSGTCSASTSSGVAEKGHHGTQTQNLDLELDLKPELDLDPAIERTFQHHWQHFFFASALTHCPSNPALEHYIKENDYLGADKGIGASPPDPQLATLLSCLFSPICASYASLARTAAEYVVSGAAVSVQHLLSGCSDYTTARSALRCLVERGYLVPSESGMEGREERYCVAAGQADLEAFSAACAWPVSLSGAGVDEKGGWSR